VLFKVCLFMECSVNMWCLVFLRMFRCEKGKFGVLVW